MNQNIVIKKSSNTIISYCKQIDEKYPALEMMLKQGNSINNNKILKNEVKNLNEIEPHIDDSINKKK